MNRSTGMRRLAALFCVLFVATAVADESTDAAIDEIIVRADYLNRPVSQLPASITVLDAETVDSLAVQHFEELVNVIPNLNWSGDGHRARYFQIRGIGERSQYQGAPNPSVGFIVDDIDFSGIGTVATLFDLDRIEVLRGPQAIRYGANALAGLIYLQSADPRTSRDGRLEFGVGSDDAYSLGIANGGALGDKAFYRVSAHHYQSDGFRDNPFLGRSDTNGRDETTLRAKLLFEFADDLDLAVAFLYADIDNGYDAFAIDNSLTVLSDDPGRDAQESIGSSVRFEWQGAESFDFTSITAAADSDIDFSFDADWGNVDAWAPIVYDFVSINDRERSTLSQEFRIASKADVDTQWLLGVYALRLNEDLETRNGGVYDETGLSSTDYPLDLFASDYESTSVSAFGQFVRPLTPSVDLDVGLRVEQRNTDYSDSNAVNASPSETMSGGHITLNYAYSDQLTAFAGLSRGYKAGGFNLGVVPDGRRTFDREEMWSFETGFRATALDGRLQLNTTLFYSVRDDQQVNTSFQIDPNDPASFVFFTDNATESTNLGLETDLRWQVSDRWQIYASLGLLETEFEDFVTAEVDNTGRELAHAPNYTIAAGAAWQHPEGWFARLDVTARDAFFFSDSHDQRSSAYELANARAGYAGETWRTEIWARNLFDRDYAVRGFFFGNEPPNFPATLYTRAGDPRQVGVTIERSF